MVIIVRIHINVCLELYVYTLHNYVRPNIKNSILLCTIRGTKNEDREPYSEAQSRKGTSIHGG